MAAIGWVALAISLLLMDVLVTDVFRGTIIWFVFGGAGFWIGRFYPWPR